MPRSPCERSRRSAMLSASEDKLHAKALRLQRRSRTRAFPRSSWTGDAVGGGSAPAQEAPAGPSRSEPGGSAWMNWKREEAAPSRQAHRRAYPPQAIFAVRAHDSTLPRSPRRLRRPSDEACYHRHGGSCRPRQRPRLVKALTGVDTDRLAEGKSAASRSTLALRASTFGRGAVRASSMCRGTRGSSEHARGARRCRPCDGRGGGRGASCRRQSNIWTSRLLGVKDGLIVC